MKRLLVLLLFSISLSNIYTQPQLGMLQGYAPGLSDTLLKGYPFSFAVKIQNIGNQSFNAFTYLNIQVRDSFGNAYFNFPSLGPDSLSLIPGQQHTVVISEIVPMFLNDGNNTVVIWPYAPDGTQSLDTLFLNVYLLNLTDIADNNDQNEMDVLIYPNPAIDYIYLQTAHLVEQVRIYDAGGKLLLNKHTCNTIPLSTLSQGIYYIEITLEGSPKMIRRKVIKD